MSMPIPQEANSMSQLVELTAVDTSAYAPQGASTSARARNQRTAQGSSACRKRRRQCGFLRHNRTQCRMPASKRKHVVHSHIREELRLIRQGKLDPSDAQILVSHEKVAIAAQFFVPCPYECKTGRTVRTYTRRGSLQRHFMMTCQFQATEDEAKDRAYECMPDLNMRGGWRELLLRLDLCQ